MSDIPLLTKNMDMTLEFFFSQKTSLFVISDCHYNHFKAQVFHYAPLLTTIDPSDLNKSNRFIPSPLSIPLRTLRLPQIEF